MSAASYKGSVYPNRRCRTTVNRRPRHSCESCTMDYIRQLQDVSMEDEGSMEKGLNIIGLQRSKSDLDSEVKSKGHLSGRSFIRENSQVYVTHVPDHVRNTVLCNREEIKATLTTIPRKGMIHLMSCAHELEGRKEKANTEIKGGIRAHHFGNNKLIRDRKMLEHIKAGRKLLKESEKKMTVDQEISKVLGEYTIKDLQLTLMEMTDIKELTSTKSTLECSSSGCRALNIAQPGAGAGTVTLRKKIVLPAINITLY